MVKTVKLPSPLSRVNRQLLSGQTITPASRFSKTSLIVFAVLFASVGVYILFKTFAAPPANFTNTTPITGLTEPTNLVFTPDGRMLILGRRGTIWVAQPGATQVDATPFLQL